MGMGDISGRSVTGITKSPRNLRLRWEPERPSTCETGDCLRTRRHLGPEHKAEVKKMTGFAPILWSVWGAFVVLLAAVHLYQSRLARDEEDQIFLGEGFKEERSAQAAIAEKVSKVEPMKRAVLWMVGGMTLVVIGYYVIDIIKQFK